MSERERDTIRVPPDIRHMPPMEALQILVNWRFEDHELLRKTHALVQLCAAQLETGDRDPRTIAQRLQTAEALAAYIARTEELVPGLVGASREWDRVIAAARLDERPPAVERDAILARWGR